MDSAGFDGLTDEQKMEKITERVLRQHTHLLCQRLDPKTHFPYLKSKFVLSFDDCEDICSYKTKSQQTDRLIDLLITKGQKGFDCLIESLINDKTQIEIVTAMHIALEEEWHKTFSKQKPIASSESEDGPENTLFLPGPRYSVSNC